MISNVFKPTDKIKYGVEKTYETSSTVSPNVSRKTDFAKKNSGYSNHSTNASHRSNSIEETRWHHDASIVPGET